ncbi:MAG: glycosyltransferase family 4 protein, partial [Rhodanobacteraceae bacterium]
MERLNWHMAAELAKVAEVRVIGPEGSAALAPHGVQVREAPLRPLWKFLVRARALARGEARTWQPRIVLAGSGLTAPLARAAARLCGAKTAVYVHGLDIAVRNIAYRALWLPAIRRMDRVIANSRATADLCRGIGMDPARVGIVHPGVDLPRNDAYLFRNEEGRAAGGASLPPLQEESRGGDGILGIDTPKRPE